MYPKVRHVILIWINNTLASHQGSANTNSKTIRDLCFSHLTLSKLISITFKKRKLSHLPRYKYRISTVWHSVHIKWSSRWRWNTREILSQSRLTKREFKRWFACYALHNLPAFDVIGSKAREIGGDDIVTIGNVKNCPWQHCDFKLKT